MRRLGPLARTRRKGWLLLSAIALLVPAGIAGASVASQSAVPRCATSNLRVDRIGTEGFTSHRSWDFALRNVSSTTCRLNGYPGVRLLGSHAQTLPTAVGHHAGPPHTVVLHPWHRAFFSFTFATNGPCSSAVFAYGVRIVPPHAAPRLVYYAGKFGLCGPPPANVTVSPVMSNKPF
jgi:hypothetical protein